MVLKAPNVGPAFPLAWFPPRFPARDSRFTEREIVEEAAQTVITLVREHRQEIRNLRTVGDTLLEQLTFAADNREGVEELRALVVRWKYSSRLPHEC